MGIYLMCLTITWANSIESHWEGLVPISIGKFSQHTEAPEQHILVECNKQPFIRIDAFRNFDESFAFKDAVTWFSLLVIGWGHSVYLIHTESMDSTRLECDSYFEDLYKDDDYLLIASGESLTRIDKDGSILWQSNMLGIDGVIVNDVNDGIIKGSGEWDPPGGWEPFQIYLETGELVET